MRAACSVGALQCGWIALWVGFVWPGPKVVRLLHGGVVVLRSVEVVVQADCNVDHLWCGQVTV